MAAILACTQRGKLPVRLLQSTIHVSLKTPKTLWADPSSPFFLLERFLDLLPVTRHATSTRMNWQDAAQRTVTGLGYELVDFERTAGGQLRIYIDRVPGTEYPAGASESGAVTVDDCEAVTRQLQYVLEVEQCDYTRLEVSSPGLDRPLKREADYARFAGERVALTLKLPLAGRKKFEGRLVQREGGWRLEVEAAPAGKGPKAARVAAKPAELAEPAGPQALDFVLDEVREAHLVPVVDFKGRARTAAAESVHDGE